MAKSILILSAGFVSEVPTRAEKIFNFDCMLILEKLKIDCSPFLADLKSCEKGSFLFRGFKNPINNYQLLNHFVSRKPVNTPVKIHDKINEIFEPVIGWKVRNGVFCYGYNAIKDNPINLGYGQQYLMFPIGNYGFAYSPQHFDLYEFVTSVTPTEQTLSEIVFKSDSLKNAIEAGELEDGLSNEISVNVESYYLVNTKHKSAIIEIIWH